MDFQGETISRNVCQINVSPAHMTDKKYKSSKLKEIISNVCALFNSGGGKLELCLDSSTQKQQDDCIRMIEQRIVEIVGITTRTSHVKVKVDSRRVTLYIQEASELVLVNYNLCLPGERQVVVIPATEPAEKIKQMTHRNIVVEKSVQIGSHSKIFVTGQHSGLHESAEVQLKSLKASSSKCVTLADRIKGKSNKFTSYISAFANHCGGHIYYGINDVGIVDGEAIKEKEKDEIIREVAKAIKKMVWPQNCQPQRGKQWDIFFEPVDDANGNPVPSTFVIVIYVAPCLGGVFTDEPETYYIHEGDTERMKFPDWWKIFTGASKRTEFPSIPCPIQRVRWSSEKNRKICAMLSDKLIQYRNNDDMTTFRMLSQLAKVNFPETDVALVVIAEEVVVAYRNRCFRKAESLLRELATHLTRSKDSSIFEVRMLLLRSIFEHSKGNYEDSYKIAQDGLQKMQQIPIDVTTVWFYIEAANVITTVLTRANELQKHSLKDKARMCLQRAEREGNSIKDIPFRKSVLQPKLHIYKAFALLECSITGQVGQQINFEDIEAAVEELASVSKSVLKGSRLTKFRKIMCRLAQSDLFRRRSEVLQEDYIQNLTTAFKYSSKARALARKHRFNNMVDYANKRRADLTEELVRHAVYTRGRQGKRDFFGLEY